MENADHGNITVDQKLCEQTSVFVTHANDDDHLPIQSFTFDVQSFETAITEHEIREREVDSATDMPASEVVLGTEIKDDDSVCFILQQAGQIVSADARRDFPLDVAQFNAVDVL